MRVLVLCVFVAAGCGKATPPAPAPAPVVDEPLPTSTPQRRGKSGLAFELDPSLGTVPAPIMVEACIREPGSKPDGVSSQHLAFRFDGSVPGRCEFPRFESPGLYVFKRTELADALPDKGKELAALAEVLAGESRADPPLVPWVDAHMAYVERTEIIDFQGGRGVLMLTEIVTEPDTLGRELLWLFQAITSDNERVIIASFPAAVSGPLPAFSWGNDAFNVVTKRHRTYAADIAKRIGAADAATFKPHPGVVRKTVESIVYTL